MKNYLLVIIVLWFSLIQIGVSQTQVFSLMHDGLTRSYRLHLPTSYDSCSFLPLVFNLHGLGSNASQQELYSQYSPLADAQNFVVVYPDAISNEWNINGAGPDDVGFISKLIDSLYSRYHIDKNRVYSCGMSMGGFMSYRLACELNDRIAAIASVTGLLATTSCNPGRAVPVMQMHGTNDPTVPFSGVDPTVQFWVQNNNCQTPSDTTNVPDINTSDGSTATRSYYGNCDDSTEVILYTVLGGGHTWPDAPIAIGVTNKDFNASQVIWEFFEKYHLNDASVMAPNCDTIVLALQTVSNPASYSIYPNPATDVVKFSNLLEKAATFTLLDIHGKVVFEESNIQQGVRNFSVKHLDKGLYFYFISNNAGSAYHGKLVVR